MLGLKLIHISKRGYWAYVPCVTSDHLERCTHGLWYHGAETVTLQKTHVYRRFSLQIGNWSTTGGVNAFDGTITNRDVTKTYRVITIKVSLKVKSGSRANQSERNQQVVGFSSPCELTPFKSWFKYPIDTLFILGVCKLCMKTSYVRRLNC